MISTTTYCIKQNRFIAFRYAVSSAEECASIIKECHNVYHNADHIVYAYRAGVAERYHDAQEPHGTAGSAIHRLLRIKKCENILIIIVRFCGKKLGKGGLMRTYCQVAWELL